MWSLIDKTYLVTNRKISSTLKDLYDFAKSFVVQLAHLYAQSVWRVLEKSGLKKDSYDYWGFKVKLKVI